jgi:hypothetical protein
MLGPTPFRPDHDRYYYEPRAFWSVGYGQPSTTGPRRTIAFPIEHFTNGSRFPIRLTKLCLSPVGYFAKSFTSTGAPDVAASMAGISDIQISIEYPMGYSGQRRPGPCLLFEGDPTADPSLALTAEGYASSLFGVSRWDFDLPYMVPQDYQIPLELSGVRAYAGLPFLAFRTSRFFFERTRSLILGHGVERFGFASTMATPGDLGYPQGRQPFTAPDGLIFNGAAGNEQNLWNAGGRWPGNEWPKQKANRGLPYTEVTGFAVHIDQRAFDDEAYADNSLTYPDLVIAPISQRIATRCKTNAAGTGEKWWRDGAPLSLVTPSRTSALVKVLEDPIVLNPGESIIVRLSLPPTYTINDGEDTVDPIYSIGASLCGYAVVEDNNRKIPPQPEFLPMPMTDT